MYRGCFIGYPSAYFINFFEALSERIEMAIVTQLRSDFEFLPNRFNKCDISYSSYRRSNSNDSYSKPDDFYDILMRDRYFQRLKRADLNYYSWCYQRLLDYFIENHIEFVFTWRDTAVQLLAIKAAQSLGIKVRIATRMRLPKERIFFTDDVRTSSVVKMSLNNDDKQSWNIKDLLVTRPEWKVSTRSFGDVLGVFPLHLRVFMGYMKRLKFDRGNLYNRYSINELLGKYLHRRLRLLIFNCFSGPLFGEVKGNFIYFGLHTQPESSIDVQGMEHFNQVDFVKHLRMSTPSDIELVVKIHPTDVDGKSLAYFKKFAEIPGVILLNHDYDSHKLIKNSLAIVTITGTAAIEAVCMNKRVFSFAPNYYNIYEGVVYCSNWSVYYKSVRDIGKSVNWDKNSEILKEFVANTFEGEVSRAYGANPKDLSFADIETLIEVYSRLK